MNFLEHRIPLPAVGLGIGLLMRYLASLFGVDYVAYKDRVRRWI